MRLGRRGKRWELVSMPLYVALAAVRVVRPQLRRDATPAARLGILLRTEVAHAARTVARALRLRQAAPDVILGRVGDATLAGCARTFRVLVARASVVAPLLAFGADVRQNDRVHVALGAPAVGGRRGVARVIAARVALVAIVGSEDGGPCVPAVGAAGPVLAAGIAGGAEFGCHVGAVRLVAAVEVRRRHFVRVGPDVHWFVPNRSILDDTGAGVPVYRPSNVSSYPWGFVWRFLLAHLALHHVPAIARHHGKHDGVREVDRHGGAARGEANQHTRDQEVEQRSKKEHLTIHFCLVAQKKTLLRLENILVHRNVDHGKHKGVGGGDDHLRTTRGEAEEDARGQHKEQ